MADEPTPVIGEEGMCENDHPAWSNGVVAFDVDPADDARCEVESRYLRTLTRGTPTAEDRIAARMLAAMHFGSSSGEDR